MKKELFVADRLSVGIDEELVSGIPPLYEREIVGLIGSNGSGKTTLLKTLNGLIEPYSGSFLIKGTIAYVEQIDLEKDWGTIAISDYCTTQNVPVFEALNLLKDRFDFTPLETIKIAELSGGQRAMVMIACAFLQTPSILLLDEPTNHLDLDAKNALITLIQEFNGAVICVSHDVWFLSAITNTLWIIKDHQIRLFSGSYADYKTELAQNEDARLRKVEALRKEERKLKLAEAREQKRVQRVQREGKKQKFDRSMGRGQRDVLTEWAQKSESRNKNRFDKISEHIGTQLDELSVKKMKKVSGSIVDSGTRGSIVRIKDATLSAFGTVLADNISLDIRYGDRIAIAGRNGSGKSSLVKSILGMDGFTLDPHPYVNKRMRVDYLDQQYALIDPNKTVLENVSDFTGQPDERIRQHLSHFLFHDTRLVHKKARELSGGMLARLAFVMLTIAPIDLLILDEPTNNLDIDTVEAIIEILGEYQGALVVISHDVGFVGRLKVQKDILI